MRDLIILISISLALVGCNFQNDQNSGALELIKNQNMAEVSTQTGLEQNVVLPKKSLLVIGADGKQNQFSVEMATTNQQRQLGLMNRTGLADDAGMLFVFSKAGVVNFWMKNTLIPLDIIFINAEKKIVSIGANAQPCLVEDCPLISSKYDTLYVLEIKGGMAEQLGIKVGDRVEWLE
jgi:uncharacterized protein